MERREKLLWGAAAVVACQLLMVLGIYLDHLDSIARHKRLAEANRQLDVAKELLREQLRTQPGLLEERRLFPRQTGIFNPDPQCSSCELPAVPSPELKIES